MTISAKQTPKSENKKISAGLFMSQDEVTESPDLWQEVFDEAIGEELHKVLKTPDVFYLVVNCMKNGLIDFSNLILWNISKFQESSRGSDGL